MAFDNAQSQISALTFRQTMANDLRKALIHEETGSPVTQNIVKQVAELEGTARPTQPALPTVGDFVQKLNHALANPAPQAPLLRFSAIG